MSNTKVNAASPVAVDAALQQELREFDWSVLSTPVPTKNERELNFKVVMQFWMIASVVILLAFLRFV